jgi:methyltransferase (TIGR00027 family)
VRNPDWLAERLLGPEELDSIAGHPIAAAISQDYQSARRNLTVAGLSNLMLVRTRFIDERLERALNDGAAQVVILGAGFDTRAYRFQDLLAGRNVFEVDYRSTQELKKRRVQEAWEACLRRSCMWRSTSNEMRCSMCCAEGGISPEKKRSSSGKA